MNLKPDPEWVKRMAEQDTNGITSVGGLVTRIAAEEANAPAILVHGRRVPVPQDVTIHDDGEGFTVSWYNPDRKQREDHPLYAVATIQEAVQEAVLYFGGLVTADQIKV